MATFADYLSTGKGEISFRLVIEGCPYIFVSDEAMLSGGVMNDGRRIVGGLLLEGLSIKESAYLPGCELNVQLSSVQIVDLPSVTDPDAATAAFTGYTTSSWLATLAGTVLASDTSASVNSATAVSVGQKVHVGTEVWLVGSRAFSGSISPDTLGSLTRGYWDTTPQGFPSSVAAPAGIEPALARVYAQPQQYAGRRCWLYGHGSSELTLDLADTRTTGTLLYRGIVESNPEMSDSQTWTVPIQSRLALFDGNIGTGAGGASKIRGIYYSSHCPLQIQFQLRAGANATDAVTATYVFVFYGFFETQADFCAALTESIAGDATLAGWGGAWLATPSADSATGADLWDLYYTPDSGTPKWIDVRGGSLVDGYMYDFDAYSLGDTFVVTTLAGGRPYHVRWLDTDPASTAYAASPRVVPRASYQRMAGTVAPTSALATAYPYGRFYLDTSASIAGLGHARLTPPTPFGSTTAPDSVDVNVSVFATYGFVDVTSDFPEFTAAGERGPTFEISIQFGSLSGCSLADFMAALVTNSAGYANTGATPMLTSDDVADWSAEVNAAAGGDAGLLRRVYSFVKPKRLIEIVREECKLLGLYLHLDADGKIGVKRLPAVDSTTPSLVIGDDVVTPGDDFGLVKMSPQQIISSVELKGAYVPADDKWLSTYNFSSLGATASTKSKGQPLSIAPVVRPMTPDSSGAGDISVARAASLVQRVLSIFGQQYQVVTVPVLMTAHAARLGDVVLVTVSQLPFAGTRGTTTPGGGLTNVRAWVIGRSWSYGDDCGGELTLLAISVNGSGYAPSCRIQTATGSGVSWTLTADAAYYGPGTVADASFFAAGYRVVLSEFDSETPTRILGTVTSVVGNNIAVTLDSAWSGIGSAPWYDLDFAAANEGVTAAQRAFCFIADPTGRISYGGGVGEASKVFS